MQYVRELWNVTAPTVVADEILLCMYTRVCTFNACIHARIHVCMHAYIAKYAYIQTYAYLHMQAHMRTCKHALHMHACTCPDTYIYTHASARHLTKPNTHTRMYAYIRACIRACIHMHESIRICTYYEGPAVPIICTFTACHAYMRRGEM
jgi:hypothetical protein